MMYQSAGEIIQNLKEKKSSIKTLIQTSSFQDKKALYAVVCETLKYDTVLEKIIDKTKILKHERILQANAATVKPLVYDFLFGRGIKGSNKFKDAILKHKSALKAELAMMKVKAKVVKNSDLIPADIKNAVDVPRFVRVNTLKTSTEDVVSHFKRHKFTELPQYSLSYDRFVEVIKDLKPRQFIQDAHIDNLLVLPPSQDLHKDPLYLSGDIILQDKASCIPAQVLNPPPGSHVVDCCAAPGNKTTHAAAIMNNKGKIFSFDRDAKRLSTMSTQTLKAGVTCCEMTNEDFLSVKTDDSKYKQVEYVIVDPSCSGSGIVGRLGQMTDSVDSSSSTRLERLAHFQVMILKHALTFPNVKRVVYSTCSKHKQENEMVVKEVVQEFSECVRLQKVLPDISSRGLPFFPGADNCLRLEPERDLTNGFFVACFEVHGDRKQIQDYKQSRNKSSNIVTEDQSGQPSSEKFQNGADHGQSVVAKDKFHNKGGNTQKHTNKSAKKRKFEQKNDSTNVVPPKPKKQKSNNGQKPRQISQPQKSNKDKKKKRNKKHRPVTA